MADKFETCEMSADVILLMIKLNHGKFKTVLIWLALNAYTHMYTHTHTHTHTQISKFFFTEGSERLTLV